MTVLDEELNVIIDNLDEKIMLSNKKIDDLGLQIDLILKYLKNQDFTLKLILSKLNEKNTNTSNNTVLPLSNEVVEKIIKEQEVVKNDKIDFPEAKIQLFSSEDNNNKSLSFQEIKKRRVMVIQTVLYRDRPLNLANVQLIMESGTLIRPLKTGVIGKWNIALDAGRYQAKIHKPASPGKNEVNHSFSFEVAASDKPLELEPINLQ